MLQIKTLITALTVICIASVCLAGLVTFMLWREAGRVLDHMHVRERMRTSQPIRQLSYGEHTVAGALFGSAGRGEVLAAQNITSMAFAESKAPHSLKTLVLRRVASEQLEQEFSSTELIHEYLELAYYGSGEYGLEQASRSMFGKDPADLTREEALALAAIARIPALRNNPEKLAERVELLKLRVE